jgi:hypothetical protein
MIATIESNCITGEVKYFNENGIEIDPSSIPTIPVEVIEPLSAIEPPLVDEPTE